MTSEQAESVVALQEIDTSELSPRHRQANRALFIDWVNQDLPRRFGLDVLGSVMLYDSQKYFLYALREPADGVVRPDMVRRLHVGARIHYWSRGI